MSGTPTTDTEIARDQLSQALYVRDTQLRHVRQALSDLYGLICEMGWEVPDNRYHLMTNAAAFMNSPPTPQIDGVTGALSVLERTVGLDEKTAAALQEIMDALVRAGKKTN